MNWISRFAAPIGSVCACVLALQFGTIGAALADPPVAAVYDHTSLTFTHIGSAGGATTVGMDDPAVRELLRREGATVTWKVGERYLLITTAEPQVVSFAIGDRRYGAGSVSLQAETAPYVQGDEAFVPFDDLMHVLSLAPKHDGGATILQPQIATLDIRSNANAVSLIARSAVPLHPRLVESSPERLVYAFDGVGSALDRSRSVNAGGIRSIDVTTSGTARNPRTIIAISLLPGAHHTDPAVAGNSLSLNFSAGGAEAPQPVAQAQPMTAPATPQSENPTAAAPGLARVTAVSVNPSADGATVNVAVSGNARFEWHRLREPDNRFWIDITGATLAFPSREEVENDPLVSMRVRQTDNNVVRIALSLTGAKTLTISPSANGVSIAVSQSEAQNVARSGEGSIGSVVSVSEAQPLVTPVPPSDYGQNSADQNAWKFFARSSYVPTNPKLIVIDPGHGGSDRGAIRNGVSEADLTLDMAKRLQQLLVARGWQVRLTRTSDVDVYAPNDSAHDELQARVDVANNAGARMFISIHVNSFINSGPRGTTTYYSKPSDVSLARTVQRLLPSTLGTKDDGIVKAHFYVTLHSDMPAVLIETAFLSNPDDYARLTDDGWRERVAQAIAQGVDAYAGSTAAPSSSGQ